MEQGCEIRSDTQWNVYASGEGKGRGEMDGGEKERWGDGGGGMGDKGRREEGGRLVESLCARGCGVAIASGCSDCWGSKAPQKLKNSHCCVPFTATFSKRRKIGAI